jgi:serine/threonine protein kinase
MNIAHRDIKADNIFVDEINETGCILYKIGDFGFATNKATL